jgi:hypothetical protein
MYRRDAHAGSSSRHVTFARDVTVLGPAGRGATSHARTGDLQPRTGAMPSSSVQAGSSRRAPLPSNAGVDEAQRRTVALTAALNAVITEGQRSPSEWSKLPFTPQQAHLALLHLSHAVGQRVKRRDYRHIPPQGRVPLEEDAKQGFLRFVAHIPNLATDLRFDGDLQLAAVAIARAIFEKHSVAKANDLLQIAEALAAMAKTVGNHKHEHDPGKVLFESGRGYVRRATEGPIPNRIVHAFPGTVVLNVARVGIETAFKVGKEDKTFNKVLKLLTEVVNRLKSQFPDRTVSDELVVLTCELAWDPDRRNDTMQKFFKRVYENADGDQRCVMREDLPPGMRRVATP